MKLSSLFGDRSMLQDPALADDVEGILRSERGCVVSRRSALKLIAGVPTTLLVYGCSSGAARPPLHRRHPLLRRRGLVFTLRRRLAGLMIHNGHSGLMARGIYGYFGTLTFQAAMVPRGDGTRPPIL